MRMLLMLLLVMAALLAAFAYWGIYTRAGRARFDEMDGIIPFTAGAVAVVMLLAAGVAGWLRSR
jgi:hypothetical protein